MSDPHTLKLRLHRRNLPALITFCTANRECILKDASCATIVMDAIRWLDAQRRMILYAAVVMPDHVHFVADPLDAPWASHLLVVNSHTGRLINRTLNRTGDVWQRQYHDRQVLSDEHLAMAIRYCELNPAKAGLAGEGESYPHYWCRFDSHSRPG